MIIDCNGKSDLCFVLTDYILVECLLDLMRRNKLLRLDGSHLALLANLLFFRNDTVCSTNAVDADVAINAREKSRNFILGLTAERAA